LGRTCAGLPFEQPAQRRSRQQSRTRFAAFLATLSLAKSVEATCLTDPLLHSDEFAFVVSAYAERFPYVSFGDVRQVRYLLGARGEPLSPLHRMLPQKSLWSITEFMAFEGSDFAEAAAFVLNGRPATETERQRFQSEQSPSARLDFVLEMDHINRKANSPVRVEGIGRLRRLWRLNRFFQRNGPRIIQQMVASLFRRESRRLQREQMPYIALTQLLHRAIQQIEAQSDKAGKP
jgi:hypothetical protein